MTAWNTRRCVQSSNDNPNNRINYHENVQNVNFLTIPTINCSNNSNNPNIPNATEGKEKIYFPTTLTIPNHPAEHPCQ